MGFKLGSESATLAVGATPVSRVYRAGRLDFLRVTLGGNDYIISGVLYQSQGNSTWAPVLPLLTASPWYGNAAIADEMEPILLALAAVPFPSVSAALPSENIFSGIPCGPAVRIGGSVLTSFAGLEYLDAGAARFYRSDTGQVFASTTFASQLAPAWHLVGRPA
jgi:hypothetical protein